MVGLQVIISTLGVSITDRVVGCVGSGGHKNNPAFTVKGARGRCVCGGVEGWTILVAEGVAGRCTAWASST